MKKFLKTFAIFLRLKAQEIFGILGSLIKLIGSMVGLMIGFVVGLVILSIIIGGISIGLTYIVYEPLAILWILHSSPNPFNNPIIFPLGLEIAVIPGLHVLCTVVISCISVVVFIEGKKFVINNWEKAKGIEAGELTV